MDVITYLCWELSWATLVKEETPDDTFLHEPIT